MTESTGGIVDDLDRWVELRRDLHAYPELRFEEYRTSEIIARELASYGYEPQRGLVGTDVVATLPGKNPSVGIILRADIDALPITELSGVPHASKTPGRMHACGHDGHTVMLLAAAKSLLREMPSLPGSVHFVFQPGEEGGAGARKMIDAGLFQRYPTAAAFGLHNWPGLPEGEFGVRAGPIMGAGIRFRIIVHGVGSHAAQPHLGVDPVPIACSIVLQCQVLSSRYKDPLEPAVISVCMLSAGETDNVIPDVVEMGGTIRTLSSELLQRLQGDVERIARGLASSHGATADVEFFQYYPATVNSAEATMLCTEVVRRAFPDRALHTGIASNLTSEDFGFMLEQRPGAYVLLGCARPDQRSIALHNPAFDFNDKLIPDGARYWIEVARRYYGE